MLKEERVDLKKNTILELSKDILEILFLDTTTNKNIIWVSKNYIKNENYNIKDKISIEKFTYTMEMWLNQE